MKGLQQMIDSIIILGKFRLQKIINPIVVFLIPCNNTDPCSIKEINCIRSRVLISHILRWWQ
ncbi:hypothetical protein JOD24_001892 [Kroppenstedtia sanguinis]